MTHHPQKIIYIRQALPGGTDNYCRALQQMFADNHLCQAMPIEDYPIIKSRFFHYYYKPAPLKQAIRKADIVHINGYTAFGTIQALRYARKYNKKVIYSPHFHPFQYLRHPKLGKQFFQILKPFIRRCADKVLTINNEDTQFFRQFHPNVVQIPHWHKPTKEDNTQPKQPGMILFVGRIDDPVKGIEHLYQIPQGKYQVHCVGKGTLQRKDFIQHTNISQHQLQQLYQQAALTVIPSKYEAFSYVALESLLANTPVLMSQSVRIADYLKQVRGITIFQYHDYTQFINKIQETIGTQVDTDKVKQIFNPQTIKQIYIDVYNN